MITQRQKTLKLEGEIYKQTKYEEVWLLKVYDYPEEYLQSYHDDERKQHRIPASDQDHAWDMYNNGYGEYKDKEVVLEHIIVSFKHLIMKSFITKIFATFTKRDEFFRNKELYSFTNDDYNLILKVREFEQKEKHQKELIDTKLKVGKAIQRAINGSAGLPADMC